MENIATVRLVSTLIALLFGNAALATEGAPRALEDLAQTALHGDPAKAAEAIALLRQAGPAGMEATLAAAGQISNAEGTVKDAVDRVCGVRDCAGDPWAVLQATPGVTTTDKINVGGDGGGTSNYVPPILEAPGVSDDQLRDLARLRRPRIHLDPASRAFLLHKQGVTDPEEGKRLVDSFESTLALDEVIDEYRMEPAILKRLIDPEARKNLDLEAFNLWIYKEVFRTPLSDPWLRLAPADLYVALPPSTRTTAPRP